MRGGGDRLVTQVITLRYESAAQLVNVLRPLISPNNTIAAYPPSNALIITDYADNLRRIERIVASLDQPPAGEPMLVPVKNASALDVVALVNRLLAESRRAAPGAPPTRAARDAGRRPALEQHPDPLGQPRARARASRQLIEQLDTPQRAGGNMFIVYLKNADAARVAETLRGAVRRRRRRRRRAPAAAPSRRCRRGMRRARRSACVRRVGGRDDVRCRRAASARRRRSPQAAR